jgi:hypothetical protein
LDETLTCTGSDASFQVARADGSVMDVSVESVAGGVRLVYDGWAADFTVEQTADGPAAVCDRTEEPDTWPHTFGYGLSEMPI